MVIPAYNVAQFIEKTLDSVFAQTYPRFEVVVIDDGSTDETPAIVKPYLERPEMVYVRQENGGVSNARNNGIKTASGEYIAFLDGDDVWHPEKLSRQMAAMGPHMWSHTDSYFVGESETGDVKHGDLEEKTEGYAFEALLICNTLTTSTVIVKKAALEAVGPFSTHYRALEDWDLWLRLAKQYPLIYLDEPLTDYLIHAHSSTRNHRKTREYHEQFIEQIYGPGGIAESWQHMRPKTLAKSYLILSYIAESQDDLVFAAEMAVRSAVVSASPRRAASRIVGMTRSLLKSMVPTAR